MKINPFLPTCLLVLGASAMAADNRLGGNVEHTDFNRGMGSRTVMDAEYVSKPTANTTLVVNGAHGERKAAGRSWDGNRFKSDLYVNWTPNLYTRTAVALADNSPVFARRGFDQDFHLIPVPGMGMTVLMGGSHTNYYGDVDVQAWRLGLTQQWGIFSGSYRFTHYSPDGSRSANGHLVSLRLNDPRGNGRTQMWLSHAKTAHAYDWTPYIGEGKNYGIALERVQPVSQELAVKLLLGRDRIETPVNEYDATRVRLGLDYRW